MEFGSTKKVLPFQPGNKAISQYRQNIEMNMSPVESLIKTYDAAIFNLRKRNIEAARKAITELILALNFKKDNPDNVKDIASGFLNTYNYCNSLIWKRKYDDAANVLQEIRDAWVESYKQQRQEHLRQLQEQ